MSASPTSLCLISSPLSLFHLSWSYSFTCHSGSLCSLLPVRLSERLNWIPPLSSAFWLYLSKVFSLCGHISRLLFLFSLWPLPFLVIFHLTSMNSNSYNMPLCTYFSTISWATSIQYTHFLDLSHIPLSKTFPFLHLSLYLSLCVFMCTMCVRPSRVFFTGAVLLCGDRLPVMVLPCCFSLFRVTAIFLTCSFFSDSASWSECY